MYKQETKTIIPENRKCETCREVKAFSSDDNASVFILMNAKRV